MTDCDKDRELDRLAKEVRKVLGERKALTEQMQGPAAALELAMPQSDLETRLAKLADSVPDDILSASKDGTYRFWQRKRTRSLTSWWMSAFYVPKLWRTMASTDSVT